MTQTNEEVQAQALAYAKSHRTRIARAREVHEGRYIPPAQHSGHLPMWIILTSWFLNDLIESKSWQLPTKIELTCQNARPKSRPQLLKRLSQGFFVAPRLKKRPSFIPA